MKLWKFDQTYSLKCSRHSDRIRVLAIEAAITKHDIYYNPVCIRERIKITTHFLKYSYCCHVNEQDASECGSCKNQAAQRREQLNKIVHFSVCLSHSRWRVDLLLICVSYVHCSVRSCRECEYLWHQQAANTLADWTTSCAMCSGAHIHIMHFCLHNARGNILQFEYFILFNCFPIFSFGIWCLHIQTPTNGAFARLAIAETVLNVNVVPLLLA